MTQSKRLLTFLLLWILGAFFCSASVLASQTDTARQAVVSLSPAATEWMYELGLGDKLVGVTEQCDYPRAATSVAKVGSFMNVSVERILSLNATDVVSTHPLPSVLNKKLERARVRVHVFSPSRLADFPKEIGAVASSLNAKARALEWSRRFARSLGLVLDHSKAKRAKEKSSLIFVSAQPVYVAASETWLSDIFAFAGYTNAFPKSLSSGGFPRVSVESLARHSSNYWFIFSRGGSDEGENISSYERLKKKLGDGFSNTKTVVLPADIFQRPGPRVIDAYLWLREELK